MYYVHDNKTAHFAGLCICLTEAVKTKSRLTNPVCASIAESYVPQVSYRRNAMKQILAFFVTFLHKLKDFSDFMMFAGLEYHLCFQFIA